MSRKATIHSMVHDRAELVRTTSRAKPDEPIGWIRLCYIPGRVLRDSDAVCLERRPYTAWPTTEPSWWVQLRIRTDLWLPPRSADLHSNESSQQRSRKRLQQLKKRKKSCFLDFEKKRKNVSTVSHGRPHIAANGVSWSPGKNGWKIKKRKHAKRAVFCVHAILWEQSEQAGENGAMLTTNLFRDTPECTIS